MCSIGKRLKCKLWIEAMLFSKSVHLLHQQKYLLYSACGDDDKGKKERIGRHISPS